jgi:hypothetical protein
LGSELKDMLQLADLASLCRNFLHHHAANWRTRSQS